MTFIPASVNTCGHNTFYYTTLSTVTQRCHMIKYRIRWNSSEKLSLHSGQATVKIHTVRDSIPNRAIAVHYLKAEDKMNKNRHYT